MVKRVLGRPLGAVRPWGGCGLLATFNFHHRARRSSNLSAGRKTTTSARAGFILCFRPSDKSSIPLMLVAALRSAKRVVTHGVRDKVKFRAPLPSEYSGVQYRSSTTITTARPAPQICRAPPSPPARPRQPPPPLTKSTRQAARMTTLAEEKHEWNAPRVRETFLEYFKSHGHTFGRFPHGDAPCVLSVLTMPFSPLVVGRPAVGSHAALRQCWYEPVQAHLPWNCGSSV